MSKCRYDLSEDCSNKNCVRCFLDRVRAEIKELPITEHIGTHKIYIDADDFKKNVLAIIDKYNGEVRDKNSLYCIMSKTRHLKNHRIKDIISLFDMKMKRKT